MDIDNLDYHKDKFKTTKEVDKPKKKQMRDIFEIKKKKTNK